MSIKSRLFPPREIPFPQKTEGFADTFMVTDAICLFGWADRIRLIFTGKIRVRSFTQTDVVVSRAITRSVAYILPPGPMENPDAGLPGVTPLDGSRGAAPAQGGADEHSH